MAPQHWKCSAGWRNTYHGPLLKIHLNGGCTFGTFVIPVGAGGRQDGDTLGFQASKRPCLKKGESDTGAAWSQHANVKQGLHLVFYFKNSYLSLFFTVSPFLKSHLFTRVAYLLLNYIPYTFITKVPCLLVPCLGNAGPFVSTDC